ncbi:MAG TPA: hypothetical protein VIF15_06465 [Polyangiaceae bacterium]
MLFGRHRVPFERAISPEPRERLQSGFHQVSTPRGESPRRPLSLLPPVIDEFEGLDRLDRAELDEE